VTPARRRLIDVLQEFSIPLLAGVAAAMLAANAAPDAYERVVHWRPFGDAALFGYALDLHYLVNELFMALFFGIAAVELTRSCLPGGDLNPPAKAVNPLIATIGGVLGPVLVF
jgi:NhaA family Na+:H+ antiporter